VSPQQSGLELSLLTGCEVSLSEENTSTLKSADLRGEIKILKTGLSPLDQSVQDCDKSGAWVKKTIGTRTCGSFLSPAIVKAHSEYTNVIHVYYAICNGDTLNNNYEGDQNRYTGDLSEE